MKQITRIEIEEKIKNGEEVNIIDVRDVDEIESGQLERAAHIPVHEIMERQCELNKEEVYYIVCATGNRSLVVTDFLSEQGFDVINIVDGMIG